MNRTLPLLPALALGVLLGLPASGQATCYRVTSVGSETTTSNTQIRPGEGTAGSWTGACDTCNGSLGLPSVVNVSDESFQPYPTLIASAVAPLTQYGATGGYDPERVFFRCSAGDAVYEMFSTNGDDLYSGYYTGADTVGNDIGLQDAYRTAWPNVLLRLTNVETGETITPIWKERQLSGLDIDSRGFQLVKAKNLAAVRAELYSAPLEAIRYYSPTILSQPYSYTQPAAYIAIKGPGLTAPTVGQAHVGGNWGGWYSNWPGAIGLYRYVTLKRYPTCAVMTVTPHVQFPPITLAEIDSGGVREAPLRTHLQVPERHDQRHRGRRHGAGHPRVQRGPGRQPGAGPGRRQWRTVLPALRPLRGAGHCPWGRHPHLPRRHADDAPGQRELRRRQQRRGHRLVPRHRWRDPGQRR